MNKQRPHLPNGSLDLHPENRASPGSTALHDVGLEMLPDDEKRHMRQELMVREPHHTITPILESAGEEPQILIFRMTNKARSRLHMDLSDPSVASFGTFSRMEVVNAAGGTEECNKRLVSTRLRENPDGSLSEIACHLPHKQNVRPDDDQRITYQRIGFPPKFVPMHVMSPTVFFKLLDIYAPNTVCFDYSPVAYKTKQQRLQYFLSKYPDQRTQKQLLTGAFLINAPFHDRNDSHMEYSMLVIRKLKPTTPGQLSLSITYVSVDMWSPRQVVRKADGKPSPWSELMDDLKNVAGLLIGVARTHCLTVEKIDLKVLFLPPGTWTRTYGGLHFRTSGRTDDPVDDTLLRERDGLVPDEGGRDSSPKT